MKICILTTFLFGLTLSSSHAQKVISTIDFVKIKNDHRPEALFYYENNWKLFRDIALEKNYIKSYKLLTTRPDTTSNNFDLILITEYSDSTQFKLNEQRFQEIIKTSRPSGLKLLNDLKPNDFRQLLFFKQTETIFNADGTRKKGKR